MKTILVDAVGTLIVEGEVFKEMQDLLDTFHNQKIILTNADDTQLVTFGLNKEMPYRLFSLKHDPDKTDPEYFQKMLKHFDLASSDVVYFEHNQEAVTSAQSVGITSYYYDSSKKDLDSLGKFLQENI